MDINPDFLAPCGLYCGVCGIYLADRDHKEKYAKERAPRRLASGFPRRNGFFGAGRNSPDLSDRCVKPPLSEKTVPARLRGKGLEPSFKRLIFIGTNGRRFREAVCRRAVGHEF